jgi:ubiquinone/menaquinone biosynthesis C-methylase UbiE
VSKKRDKDRQRGYPRAVKLTRIAPVAAAGGLLGAALWWRKHPTACPYSQRFWVQAPHPFITRERLRDALAPSAGERLLEVGPGTGYYTLPVARSLHPDGVLDIFDLQPEMLEYTARAAREQGLGNIVTTQGDARSLPYQDDTFDGAFLVATLGEVPDQDAALRELSRVLKPGGRLVVGEVFGDPHWVRLGVLRQRAQGASFRFEQRVGGALGYFARFRARPLATE